MQKHFEKRTGITQKFNTRFFRYSLLTIMLSYFVSAPTAASTADEINRLDGLVKEFSMKGNYPKTHQILDELIKKLLDKHGPKNQSYIKALNKKAEITLLSGEYDKAILAFQSVISIIEKNFAKDDPTLEQSLNGLAETYQAKKDYNNAITVLKRVIAIAEKNYGKDDLRTQLALSNLATIYRFAGRKEEAEALFK